jgi:hypothetical protein
MAKERLKPTPKGGEDQTPDPEQSGLALGGPEGPRGSELNPVTITREEWGQKEEELAASVRDALGAPSPDHREAVLSGLRRLAKSGSDWHSPGQIARGLLAPQAQPILEQLVGEGLAEQAVRASGWRCLVYRVAPEEHAAEARR